MSATQAEKKITALYERLSGAVPLCLILGTLAFGHGILPQSDSCSDGHSVDFLRPWMLSHKFRKSLS